MTLATPQQQLQATAEGALSSCSDLAINPSMIHHESVETQTA